MATIKSYTDINQSKKLAEILPLKSVDMYYCYSMDIHIKKLEYDITPTIIDEDNQIDIGDIPCWSLTALLATLPNEIITDNKFECHYQIHIRKYNGGDNTTLYQIAYGNDRGLSGSWYDMINTGEKENPVDACYEMILKLYELKML